MLAGYILRKAFFEHRIAPVCHSIRMAASQDRLGPGALLDGETKPAGDAAPG
jgi:hypothetical protein